METLPLTIMWVGRRAGYFFGVDGAQQLLALCAAAVSDPWYLEGWFRELITRDPSP